MSPERRLQRVLRIVAVVAATAIIPVFMPRAWMDLIHRWLGLGELPQGPVFDYLARSISLLYAVVGGFIWIMSRDPHRYRAMIRYFGTAQIGWGLVLLWIDHHAALPLPWILAEGPTVILLGAIVLSLQRRLPQPPAVQGPRDCHEHAVHQ